MQYIKTSPNIQLFVSLVLALFCSTYAQIIFAEEGASPGAEVKAGASEGGSSSDREWAKRQTKLNVYEAKVKDLTKEIQHMIILKNTGGAAVDEKGKPIDVLDKISTSYKKLKETVTEYNAEKSELKYRFPEEGLWVERQYVPLRVQTLEQIEKGTGLDSELNRTKLKIDKKYATFVGDELAKPPPPKNDVPNSTLKDTKQDHDKNAQRIKLSQ